jgi:glycosyltransferase involved in cell wall biosynthesis
MVISVTGVTGTERPTQPRFLILLFGTLEYDGRAQRMLAILKGLGHVTVVDIADQGADQIIEKTDVHRVQVCLPKRVNKIRRHMLFWWVALRTARRTRPSVVVAENFFTTLPGWISARLCRAKLVYDAYELIIPDPTRLMSKRDYFWYLLERWTVRRADLVIAANEERSSLMAAHYHLKQAPVVMRNIPQRIETGVQDNTVLQRYSELSRRTPDEVLVLYQGDVTLARGIGRFVEALRYLPPRFRLVVVGGGPDLDRLKVQVKAHGREGQFTALGRVPHRLLPAITRLADVGIVTYSFQGLNNIYCAPNKIYEYAQAGLPVVATSQPPLRRLVESYGIGRLVGEHDSPEEVAAVIREVAENKARYTEALLRFLQDHKWEDEAKRVRAALDSILVEERCTL